MQQLPDRALPIQWVERLITRMQALYGAKFAAQWEGVDLIALKQAWAEELAGYSGEEIARGLSACRERPFPPTLPEFMVLCRPPVNPEIAFHEAVHCLAQRRRGERGDWTHPAIYHATVTVGQHDVMNCPYSALKARWGKALADELAKGQWAPVPDAYIALPDPGKTEASNAEAKAAMDRLGAADIMNKSGRDHKAWAKKIMDNPKGRSPAVVAMAKRALEGAVA